MKIVLKEEVYNLGLAGDVVDVADGYGRNYLIPAGIAIPATDGAIREAERLTRARKAREAETVDEARATADDMESRTLVIETRVDETGTLYGSVGRSDIQRVLKERGHAVDERKIDLKGTIKQIGTHEIPVRVHPQVTATVTVDIVDVEGEVGVEEEEPERPQVQIDVDEDSVSEAAAAAAVGSDTNVEALAEQALQAAREYEEQQLLTGEAEAAAAEAAAAETDEEEEETEAEGEGEAAEHDAAEGHEPAEDEEPMQDTTEDTTGS